MKNLRVLTVGVLVLALAAAVPLVAQKASKQKPMMHQQMKQEMMCQSQLDLTPEQQEKIQKMKLQFQKEMLTLQTELKTKMLDLRALMTEKADSAKINAKIDEIAEARAAIQKKAYAHHMEVRNILTDEQKVTFDKMSHMYGTHMGDGFMGHGFGMSCKEHSHSHGMQGMHGMKNPCTASKK
ncbi:MAG: periplasmic heavy metal sensor [Candidatus Aminicenantes bacterium]|nr:periplasmic heavy metal sensor [Candidatus Aminicenantes bacterium]